MKASETNLQSIIEGTKQYVVPLFQRAYSWDTKNWNTLWTDLLDLCEEEEARGHFIGSIVTAPTDSVPQGVTKYLLIDGQQRLTTLFILLAVIRDQAKSSGSEMLAQEIEEVLLTNRFKQGLEFWKLLPTQADREAFLQLLQIGETTQQTLIYKAFSFFKRQLKAGKGPDLVTLKNAIVNDLVLVSIVLHQDDNPHLIFESLNAKGTPLSQADLVRNFFFMKVSLDKQEGLYESYWEPLREQLQGSLTEYVRHFLTKDGEFVKQPDVYFTLKQRAEGKSEEQIIAFLKELSKFGEYYVKLLRPSEEPSGVLRERLTRLHRIQVTVAYPFLLNVYDDYANQRVSEDEFASVLDILENFMIRRFVCSVPTNQLNKIFPTLYAQASEHGSLSEGVKVVLRNRNYPRDTEFRERFVASRLYGPGDRGTRTKLILERLESSFGNKEAVKADNLTIEHVMPQTLTDWWKEHLGNEFEATHELFLHTVGNLTLTAYNSELSNADFSYKRQIFKDSHLDLNNWFQGLEEWNEAAIKSRAETLAELALSVWPYFGVARGEEQSVAHTVTGRTPTKVVILGERFSVSSWREVAQKTLETVFELDPDAFGQVMSKFPRFVSETGERFRTPRQLSNGTFMESNLSASAINRFCVQVVEEAGLVEEAELSPQDWYVETM